MTTPPKARRFRLRLTDDPAARPPGPVPGGAATANRAAASARTEAPPLADEGTVPASGPASGALPGRPARPDSATATAPASDAEALNADLDAIRAEGLTGRQLRLAMRIAQRNGLRAASGPEAVLMLRKQGIDPFDQAAVLDILRNGSGPEGAATTGTALATTVSPPLPRTQRMGGMLTAPAAVDPAERTAQVNAIRDQIAQRRRRRSLLLLTRLGVFVLLPTLLAAWYFFAIATPLYATNSEFVIQQADAQATPQGGLQGLFGGTGLAGSQDSVTVQSYLNSRDAMRRLDAEAGFKAHFSDPAIDPLRRLSPDATDEEAYRLYRRMVQVSFDPTEGIIRMEVVATDPQTSERFARALVAFAEEQVDNLTQRLRENQMRDATDSYLRAEERMVQAQLNVLELQERFQVLSSEVEVSLLTQQIAALEGQLNQERLSLQDLLSNSRPNAARVQQSERRIAALEGQIGAFRSNLTNGRGADGTSLARIQRELVMAEADVATRQMLLAQSLQQLEAARIEANRQVRYLSLGVSPIAPDEPTYPRGFANTALAFLLFAGIYLMAAMTGSILREQVTS
jgi:capsular polysaccharide transport system permease protein